jgi:outer membrane protein assembly factor BamB
VACCLLLGAQAGCSDAPAGANHAAASEQATPKASVVSVRPGTWPIFRGDRALTGVAAGELPDAYEMRWSFEVGESIASSPVVADGKVFFGADDGKVYAVALATGEKVWEYETEDIVEAPPLFHDGRIFIGSSDFYFYALDASTGTLAWRTETDDRVLGGANWVNAPDGKGVWIVVGCYDNRLYCFDAASGKLEWTYETGNYVNGTPAVLDDTIIFGGCDAAVHVVSAKGEPVATVPLCEECHIPGSVAIADRRIFFGHYGNAFVWTTARSCGSTRTRDSRSSRRRPSPATVWSSAGVTSSCTACVATAASRCGRSRPDARWTARRSSAATRWSSDRSTARSAS